MKSNYCTFNAFNAEIQRVASPHIDSLARVARERARETRELSHSSYVLETV